MTRHRRPSKRFRSFDPSLHFDIDFIASALIKKLSYSKSL